MKTNPSVRDRVHVQGRRGKFVVVSVEDRTAHLLPLDGAPSVIRASLDQIEPAPDMKPRTHKDEQGSIGEELP